MRFIGRYQILGLLGRGGMGAVYKARLPHLDRIVAVKLLDPMDLLEAIVGIDELDRRFVIEAKTMAHLNHRNIAAVWDLERDESGRPFFVMDYCCNNVGAIIGETYKVEDPSRILRFDRAVNICKQALHGLARLHYAGVVHRDMKPFNLLMTQSGTVRIIDFGLSKLRGERISIHGSEKVGSPYYAAPEQEADPEAASERSDLYSVGVMLHRMLTGRLPQLACDPPSLCNPDLDSAWDAFFATACAKESEKRFESAWGMLAELERLEQEWIERTANTCALPIEEDLAADDQGPVHLRRSALKTGPKVSPYDLDLDSLWRPEQYIANAFEAQGGTVFDKATNLHWEQSGCEYPVNRQEAQGYIDSLNNSRFGGYSDWRLPTVDELKSLLTPVAQGRDLCIPPQFDPRQARLWSCDRRTFTQSWTADVELGFISRHDDTCSNFVRAVRCF